MIRLGVLVSGSGTNLQAILDRCGDGFIDGGVALVISNRPGARGLQRAEAAGVPTALIDHRTYSNRAAFDAALVGALDAADVELVALAGFDRLVTATLLDRFPNRVMNIHPALLPAFKGLDAQRQAAEYGVKIVGATVHFVDEHLDHGPIIVQGAVPVGPDDTPDAVRERILAVEHAIYPEAIRLFAEGRIRVEGRRVHVHAPRSPTGPPLIQW